MERGLVGVGDNVGMLFFSSPMGGNTNTSLRVTLYVLFESDVLD